jgi:uncharacterized protein YneF (UPF0154 family)
MRSLRIFVVFLALMGLLLLGAFYSYRAVARKQVGKPRAAGTAIRTGKSINRLVAGRRWG